MGYMNKIINAGAAYFSGYLGTILLDFIVKLSLNELLTSILSFISIIIKAPKNIFDVLLETTELGNIFLLICGICFVIKIVEFWNNNRPF